jgi:hypothetical protein
MKFILSEEHVETFKKTMEECPIYSDIKYTIEPHKDNGLGKLYKDSFWVKLYPKDQHETNFILQAILHTGLRHNFNKYFINKEVCL